MMVCRSSNKTNSVCHLTTSLLCLTMPHYSVLLHTWQFCTVRRRKKLENMLNIKQKHKTMKFMVDNNESNWSECCHFALQAKHRVQYYLALILVQAKCMRFWGTKCPLFLEFFFFFSAKYFSIRRGCCRGWKFYIGFLNFKNNLQQPVAELC